MKYCEKCGNKLDEGFAFCNKCGAKISDNKKEEKEKKEEVEKVEKVERVEKKVERPLPPVPPPMPPKSGKGKIVFLTILNILFLGAAITFLVLWLIKPTDSNCNSNYKSNSNTNTVDPTPTPKESKLVGKWYQNLEYKKNGVVFKRIYGMINIKSNGEFESTFYDKDNKSQTLEELEGTYVVNGSKISLTYSSSGSRQTTTMFLDDDDKLCFTTESDNCLVMDSYNNKIVIERNDTNTTTNSIKTITYSEYEKIQKDYKDAIVVVVHDGCSWCQKFEPVVEEIAKEFNTPVYYYENDGRISVSGTPTTIIIKNGYVIDSVNGYKDYSSMEEILEDLGVR